MSRAKPTGYLIAVTALAALTTAQPAHAAMTALSSLTNPTVQSLIDLGTGGATAGDARYFNFSYAPSADAPAADAVRVQSIGNGSTNGLRFVASWIASGGQTVSSTIGYDVASLDGDPIQGVSLLSNGSAPIPGARTFATATASTATQAGSPVASILTTFDDGQTSPTDTTLPDVDSASTMLAFPQSPVSLTDTVTVVAGTGGVASASFIQNGFTFAVPASVPEPTVAAALVVMGFGLLRRRSLGVKVMRSRRSTNEPRSDVGL